jgi:hypothetical protein
MNTPTNNLAGAHAVAVSSRGRAGNAAYRSASWSALEIFGCVAIDTMTSTGHKTTRPRPLEPSQ